MKITQPLKIIISCFITLSYANAADNYNIVDQGMDMNTRYYSVGCPDGTVSSVSVEFDFDADDVVEVDPTVVKARVGNPKPKEFKIKNVCTHPATGESKCKKSWELQSAAKASCS